MAEYKIADNVQMVRYYQSPQGGVPALLADSENKAGGVTSKKLGDASDKSPVFVVKKGDPAKGFPVIDLLGVKLNGASFESGAGATVTVANANVSKAIEIKGAGTLHLLSRAAAMDVVLDAPRGAGFRVPLKPEMAALGMSSAFNPNAGANGTITITSGLRLAEGKEKGSIVVEHVTADGKNAMPIAIVGKNAKFEVVYNPNPAEKLEAKDMKVLFTVDPKLGLAANQKALEAVQKVQLKEVEVAVKKQLEEIKKGLGDKPIAKTLDIATKTRVVEKDGGPLGLYQPLNADIMKKAQGELAGKVDFPEGSGSATGTSLPERLAGINVNTANGKPTDRSADSGIV